MVAHLGRADTKVPDTPCAGALLRLLGVDYGGVPVGVIDMTDVDVCVVGAGLTGRPRVLSSGEQT